MEQDFLPISREDMQKRGIAQLDFVYVCGDAYVDHPSFGHAIITRLLEAHGYRVGIIAQPDWRDDASVTVLGEPRLGFLVSAGNMDSMVNHYSVSKKRRKTDAFSPGGEMGKRPDYATIVYCNLIRHTYKHTPIIIGGIEASLRRSDFLWNGGAFHSGNCRCTAGRDCRQRYYLCGRDRIPHAGCRVDGGCIDAPVLRRYLPKQRRIRQKFLYPVSEYRCFFCQKTM